MSRRPHKTIRCLSFVLFALLSAAGISCIVKMPPPPEPPPPPLPPVAVGCVVYDHPTGYPIAGATCEMDDQHVTTNADGYGVMVVHPGDQLLSVMANHYDPYLGTYHVEGGENIRVDLDPSLPDPPHRDAALAVMSHGMQGLICHTDQFGDLYWWDAAIAWLTPEDRKHIYACKLAVGDTHIFAALPVGRPLYDECCNDYSPDRFPALDWSAGESLFDHRLADLVVEIREAGLIPVLFPDERVDHSQKDILLALAALEHSAFGDLRQQVVFSASWDGAFYGWTQGQIEGWAKAVRGQCIDCYLAFEFSTGHIPQEAGIDMSGYDVLLIEFEREVHNWNMWQILPRLIGEQNYHRPSDDTSPHPVPRMPMQTPRGEIQTVCFEFKTYWWVRHQETVERVNADRAYLLAAGCPAIA